MRATSGAALILSSVLVLDTGPCCDSLATAPTFLEGRWTDRADLTSCGEDAERQHRMDDWKPEDEERHQAGFRLFQEQYPFTRGKNRLIRDVGFPARFDWKANSTWTLRRQNNLKQDPSSVFLGVHDVPPLQMLLEIMEERFDNGRTDRIAYFSTDLVLSKVNKRVGRNATDKLRKFFGGGIFWQAYDVHVEGFRVAPDGFNGLYMESVWPVVQQAIASAEVSLAAKPKQALAAWGFRNTWLNDEVPARTKLRSWAVSEDARAMGVEDHCFEPWEWWQQLPRYRFLLSPRGGGVQSPKNDEALLVLTVPITTREGWIKGPRIEPAFDDLQRLGWPIVVLDEWSEITASELDRWWEELSPRLVSFRRNCLSTEGFWGIVTGRLQHCE